MVMSRRIELTANDLVDDVIGVRETGLVPLLQCALEVSDIECNKDGKGTDQVQTKGQGDKDIRYRTGDKPGDGNNLCP